MGKTYCDECKYLQNREIKVNGTVTGTRYYCSKKNWWFGIGSTFEEVGLNCCAEGKRKEAGNESI